MGAHNYVINGVWGPHSHGAEPSHKYRDPSYVAKLIIVNCQEYTISNEKKYKGYIKCWNAIQRLVTMYRHYKSKVYYYLDNTLVVAQHRSHGTTCFRYHSKTFYNTPVVCSCSRQTLPHVFHCPCSWCFAFSRGKASSMLNMKTGGFLFFQHQRRRCQGLGWKILPWQMLQQTDIASGLHLHTKMTMIHDASSLNAPCLLVLL